MAWNVKVRFIDGDVLEESFDTEDEAEDFADEYTTSEYDNVDEIDVTCDEDDDAGYYRVLHDD